MADAPRSEDRTPPSGEVRVDVTNLRGVAHPVRLRALGLLRRNGPATASQLASQMGESSGSLSYHLRQLAAHGFVVDDERESTGRERWWRAVHRSSRYDDTEFTPDERIVGTEYLRVVGQVYADRIRRFADHWDTLDDEVGPGYGQAATMSDWILQLSPERALELRKAVEDLIGSYRDTPDTGEDVLPVSALFVLTPGRNA
ncbi:winged helix-turn-helix domain-containing protein [Jatrophihabitans sp. YIM 134969]